MNEKDSIFNFKNIDKGRSEHAGVSVKILDYDPRHHRVKVVRADNNQPLRSPKNTDQDIEQVKPFDHRSAKTLKTFQGPEGPILEVNDEMAFVQGSSQYGFFSTKNYGNIIKGPLSIEALPHEIRLSGVNMLNPLITSGFPSTIVTPLPTTIFSLPGAAMVGQMSKDIAVMSALVGIGGI